MSGLSSKIILSLTLFDVYLSIVMNSITISNFIINIYIENKIKSILYNLYVLYCIARNNKMHFISFELILLIAKMYV